jgi:hypothetical protein
MKEPRPLGKPMLHRNMPFSRRFPQVSDGFWLIGAAGMVTKERSSLSFIEIAGRRRGKVSGFLQAPGLARWRPASVEHP